MGCPLSGSEQFLSLDSAAMRRVKDQANERQTRNRMSSLGLSSPKLGSDYNTVEEPPVSKV